jgi:lysophospholipase L1-like esterase
MRKLWGVGAAAAAAVAFGACLLQPPTWTTPTSSNGDYTGVVGDSLTVLAQNGTTSNPTGQAGQLTTDLTARGFPTSVSSAVGATTSDLSTMGPFPAPGPTILVIALGTNDVGDGNQPTTPLPTVQANIQNYLATSTAKCVYLVGVNTVTTSWDLPKYGPPYNAMLQSLAAASNGRIHYADWASEVIANPSYLDASGGPHLSAAGVAAYRALIEASVTSC